MALSDSLKPLNILLMSGPELAGAGIDSQDFSQAVASLPNCRVLPMDPTRPTAEQEEQVRTFLGEEQNPVLLVAKDPEYRGAGVARLLRGELGLNPEYLLPVDLTAALEHPEQSGRTAKGLEMIRQAASQASLARPIVLQEIPVSRHILVWGDSFAALKAARDLAESGYPVILASPNPEFKPIPWEYSGEAAASDSPDQLIHQVQEHRLIKKVYAACMKNFEGVTGNFTVRLDTPKGCLTERVGAVILAPELYLQDDPRCYGVSDHPGAVSLSRLEALLAGTSETELPETVVILLGLAGESHPLALERTLRASSRLLTAGSNVYLLVGNTKLAGPDLQREVQVGQGAGLVVIKLHDCPSVSVVDEGLRVEFLEPSIRENLALKANLVVYDEQCRAARENAGLAELLRLPLGAGGFLQTGNVHHTPVATPRRGIYVAGPGRGIMDQEGTDTDVNAVINEIQGLLGQGQAVAPQGRAVVDRGKCVFCLTCYRFCPHGAITWDNRAIINELACQGCGICASQCPNDAIQVQNFSDDQMAAQLEVLDPQVSPRIVAYMCRNSAWEAYQSAVKLHSASLPVGFTPIKVPCAGKVDPDYLLRAFTSGADGVLVLSCPQDNCKSTHGNLCAEWGVEQAQELLAEAGIDPGRLLFHSLAANAPGDLIDAVDELMANLRRLTAATDDSYPVWLATGTAFKEHRTVPRTYSYTFEYQEQPEVLIEISAEDARNLGIRSGEQFRTTGREGVVTATAMVTKRVRPGTAFLPRQFLKNALDLLLQGGPVPGGTFQSYEGLAVNLEKLVEQLEEVFGIKVPTSRYLHQGHTWVAVESGGRVRIGMDDFSQKVLGSSDDIKLPVIGAEIRRDKTALALFRQGGQAGVLAPVAGVIEEVNPQVQKRPGLTHDDPYGEGWMMLVAPTNLKPDLGNLFSGEGCATWIEEETARLLAMLEPSVGATLQAGGALIDDVYSQCPELGWDRLVKEFLRSA